MDYRGRTELGRNPRARQRRGAESLPTELLNRIDEVVIFRPLGREEIKKIVDIQLDSLRRRLEERHITLQLTDAAKELVAHEGFDPVYGARPLRRTIQKEIVQPLAVRLLRGDFHDGDAIAADAPDGELTFERSAAAGTDGVVA